MNEYVQAIRTGKMHEFRRNYREGIDVLLVDDVQFLAGKDEHAGRVLPHVQRAPREPQADRPDSRPQAARDLGHRRPPAHALCVGLARRHRAARARGPHRDPPQEGSRRGRHPSRRRRALHRIGREVERPRARRRADPARGLRVAVRSAASTSSSHRRRSAARSRVPARSSPSRRSSSPWRATTASRPPTSRADRRHKSLAQSARGGDVPVAPPHQGSYPGPRARVRRQAPHDGDLGRSKDRGAPQGGRVPALRDPRDRGSLDEIPEAIRPCDLPCVTSLWIDPWTNLSLASCPHLCGHGIHRLPTTSDRYVLRCRKV